MNDLIRSGAMCGGVSAGGMLGAKPHGRRQMSLDQACMFLRSNDGDQAVIDVFCSGTIPAEHPLFCQMMDPGMRAQMDELAVNLARGCNYTGPESQEQCRVMHDYLSDALAAGEALMEHMGRCPVGVDGEAAAGAAMGKPGKEAAGAQMTINEACEFLRANSGDSVATEVFCSGTIPAVHPVFCEMGGEETQKELDELKHALSKGCHHKSAEKQEQCMMMHKYLTGVVAANEALMRHMGQCESESVLAGGAKAPSNGLIPIVPHYEPFAVIPTLPHLPPQKEKRGTRLHYHGEPVDLQDANGAAYDFETNSLRVGSTECRADQVRTADGRCVSRWILM